MLQTVGRRTPRADATEMPHALTLRAYGGARAIAGDPRSRLVADAPRRDERAQKHPVAVVRRR